MVHRRGIRCRTVFSHTAPELLPVCIAEDPVLLPLDAVWEAVSESRVQLSDLAETLVIGALVASAVGAEKEAFCTGHAGDVPSSAQEPDSRHRRNRGRAKCW